MVTRHAGKLDTHLSLHHQALAFLPGLLAVVMLLSMLLPAAHVHAAFPLTETFMGPTAPGWVLGGSPTAAILTSGNADPAGNGWLRLTTNATYQAGYAYYNTPIPTGRGLVITFDYAAWGGAAADGLTFFLFDGATTTFNVGASGGSLGYAQKTGLNGLSNGYLGLGLDEFGNYSNPTEGRIGGTGAVPEAVAIRGPGSALTGYTYLAGTTNLTTAPWNLPKLDCPKNFTGITNIGSPSANCGAGVTRPASSIYSRQVQITVTPVGSAYQVTVAMKFSPTDTFRKLFGPYTMTTSSPGTLKMGFAGSTGGQVNYHEIRNLSVTPQVPDLTASKAVANATTGGGSVTSGDQLLYTVVLKNNTSTDITGVSFSDTIPTNTTYVANSATVPTGSTLAATSPALSVTGITVPASGQATITFKVQVASPIPVGTTQISNQGSFTYGTTTSQTDGDAVTDGNQATTISVTAGPNFDTTTKTVSIFTDTAPVGAVSPGDVLLYHVVIPNTGNQDSPTTTFSDVLPSNTTYVTGSATASSGTVSYTSGTKTLSWAGSVAAGSQVTIDFKVTVNSGVAIRDVISNQGTVTSGSTSVLTDADLATPGKQPTQLLVGGVATLTATKTATVTTNGGVLQPGGRIDYTILITNTGSYAVNGATFVDSLPANTSYVSSSTTVGTITSTSPTLNITGISLAVGASATIHFVVQVNSPLTGVTQISNQGVVNYDSNQSGANNTSLQTDGDPNSAGQQATVTTITNADLAVTKTVDNNNPAETGTIVYTVKVTNNGPVTATSVSVADTLPSGLSLVSSSATQGSYTSPTWTVGTLNSGTSATLTITATVNLGQGGGTITNSAGATSALYDPTTANNTASVGLTVKATTLSGTVTDAVTHSPLSGVTVQVTGTSCAATTVSNGAYSITSGVNSCLLAPGAATVAATAAPAGYLLTSAGKTIVAGVANIQDLALVRPSLSGVVTDLGTGVPIVGATVTLTQNSTTCTATTVAGGTYIFTAGSGTPACNFTTGAATVAASAAGYQPTNPAQSVTILSTGPTTQNLALGTTDLLITKTDGKSVVQPGESLSYAITVVNNGSITAETVTLTDTLPAYLTYVSATGTGWTCGVDGTGKIITCTINSPGSLAPTVSMTVTVVATVATSLPDGTTSISNYAKVTTTSPEKDTANNEVSDVDTVTTHPDLTLSKTFTSPPPAATNSIVSYRLQGSNIGHATASTVRIVDALDSRATYNTNTAQVSYNNGASWTSLTPSGTGTLTFSLADLAPGATYILIYNVTVGTLGSNPLALTNSATISAAQTDLNTSNNTSSISVPTVNDADVAVVKTATVNSETPKPGDEITYTLAYRNDGTSQAADVTITDSIPAYTTFVNGSITGGGTKSGDSITWSLGALASLASGSVSFKVTINSPLPAGVISIDNTANITTTSTDLMLSDNSSSVSTTVTAQPDLVITKSNGVSTVTAGQALSYTITYSNAGNQTATGVTIVDTLLNGIELDGTKLSGNTYSGSSPTSTYDANVKTLTWNISSLAVDGNHTITVDMKVKTDVLPGSVVANRVTIADDGTNGADPNPEDNTATDSDLVIAPYVVLEKHASVPSGNPAGVVYTGQQVTYTIDWRNSGGATASNVVIQDTLPANMTLVTDSITVGGTLNNGVITWNLGSRSADAFGSVGFAVTVNPGAGGDSQTSATLSAETGSGSVTVVSSTVAPSNPSNCESVLVNGSPVSKCSSFKGIYQGSTGTPPAGWNDNPRLTAFDDSAWTQPVAPDTDELNLGFWVNPATLSAAWVTMNTPEVNTPNFSAFRQPFCLPLNATGLSATLELAGDDVSDIYLNGADLGLKYGAGAAETFNGASGIQSGINFLAVHLLNNRHGGHPQFNGGDHSGLLFNIAAAYTGLRPFASGPSSVKSGQTLTFTVKDTALGGRTPYEYKIDFGDNTTPVAYQSDKTLTHTYTNTTASPVVYTATLTARDAYGCTGVDHVSVTVLPVAATLLANGATVTYKDAVNNSYTGTSGAGVQVIAIADLSIAKSVISGGTLPGLSVNYQIVVTNNGPDEVTGATVVDSAPSGVIIGTWSCTVTNVGSGGSVTTACGAASGSGNINTSVTMKNGAVITYTVPATIAGTSTGTIGNTATVAAPTGITDLTTGNNSSTASTTLLPVSTTDSYTVSYSTPYNGNILTNDVGAGLTVSSITYGGATCATFACTLSTARGTVYVQSDGTLRYDPTPGYYGADSFTYVAKDSSNQSTGSATVNLTVQSPLVPPLALNDSVSTNYGVPVVVPILANDAGGMTSSGSATTLNPTTVTFGRVDLDTLTGGIQTVQGTWTVNSANGNVTFAPAAGFSGTASIPYTVNDSVSQTSNTALISVTVGSTTTSAPPIANSDNTTTPRNATVVLAVLANDAPGLNGSGIATTIDPTTVTLSNGTEGNWSVNPSTGAVTYEPANNFTGTATATYTVKDNLSQTSLSATLTVIVTGGTGATALPDQAATKFNTPVSLAVLDNDTPSGSSKFNLASVALTGTDLDPYTSGVQTVEGTWSVNSYGVVTFSPNTTYYGTTAPMPYAVTDTNSQTTYSTITVTVTGADMSVSLANLPGLAKVGVSYSGNVTCTNGGNEDADNATCGISGLPAGLSAGSCTISTIGVWTSPGSVPAGAVVTCSVSGTPTAAGTTTVTGSTGAYNDPVPGNNYTTKEVVVPVIPTAVNDGPYTTRYEESGNTGGGANILSNDVGTGLTVAGVAGTGFCTIASACSTNHGTVIVLANGTFSYTPELDYTGPDNFTYYAKDSYNQTSNVATVGFNILAPAAPLALNDTGVTPANTLLISDALVSGQSVTNASILTNDTIFSTPATKTLVNVTGTGGACTPTASPYSPCTVTTTHGSVVMKSDGTYIYYPNANYSGTDSFTYQFRDASPTPQLSNIATVTLTIQAADVTTTVLPPNEANDGSNVSVLVSFSNVGDLTAAGVTYSATLPPGLTGVRCDGATCSYSYVNGVGTVTITGLPTSLSSGQTENLVLHYTAPSTGTVTVQTAITTTTSQGANTTPDTASDITTITSATTADMTTTVTAPQSARFGETVTTAISYTNFGPAMATSATYSLTLPPGLTTSEVSCSGATCEYTPGTGAVAVTGLAGSPTSVQTQNIFLTYKAPATGPVTVTSTTGATNDSNAANNTASDSTDITTDATADVTTTIAAPAVITAGSSVYVPITFSNLGPAVASSVTYTLTLPTGLTPSEVSCTGATCTYDTGVVSVSGLSTTLFNGQTVGLTLTYKAPVTGPVTVTSTVSTATSESNGGNNSASASSNLSSLTIVTLTNGTNNDVPNGPKLARDKVVTWSYVVTNRGVTTLTSLQVTDSVVGTICDIASLGPGASDTCTKTGIVTLAHPYMNTGSVTGYDPGNNIVTATNPDYYYGVQLCDVDGDGTIGKADINLIYSAIGTTVGVGDPRDYDGNGIITINDARGCVLKCSKANCAQ